MKKRLMALLLSLCMILALAACGETCLLYTSDAADD